MADAKDRAMSDVAAVMQGPHDYSDLLQTVHSDAFAFSDQEQVALDLYDELQELELQKALLEAQTGSTYRAARYIDCF
jgi:hypothetical protein